MNQPLVALDIGSTKVACAIGLPHGHASGFELLGSSLVPYPTLSERWCGDPLMVSQTIEQALDATGVQTDVDQALVMATHPALISEHTHASIALSDELTTVRAQDLERLQRIALDYVLAVDREPLLVERLGCSGNGFKGIRDPTGLTATRLLGAFHVITIPMAARRALVQAVESAGLEVAQLTYTLPAVFAGAGDEELRRRRILVIDVGGLATDIGLFTEGILRTTRIAPWGGLKLATTIAADLHVTMDQALTWSLEGAACRKSKVCALIKHQWETLTQPMHDVLQDEPRPDAAIVTGRGALIDGFAEWVERITDIPTVVGRSSRLTRTGDLARQVGLTPVVGLLDLATRQPGRANALRSPQLLNRLIERTRTILTEYF